MPAAAVSNSCYGRICIVWKIVNMGRLGSYMCIGLLTLVSVAAAASPKDTTSYELIGIEISGLKKTKEAVVRRELPFREGDNIEGEALMDKLGEGERQLMNTGLFLTARIHLAVIDSTAKQISLAVLLQEAWYIYPIPLVELADRNFNVWWVEQGAALNRINVGILFTHNNFSGWNDELKVGTKYGYTQSVSLGYRFPYANEAQTLGVFSEMYLARNREINYATEADRQAFYQSTADFIYWRSRLTGGLIYRPRLYTTQEWALTYYNNRVDEAVAEELNPSFLGGGRVRQQYLSLRYRLQYDRRDVWPYPWRGHYLSAMIEADGMGIFPDRRDLTIYGQAEKYFPFSEKMTTGFSLRAKWSLIREPQPYNDNRALGFGESYLNGYEYYVIDGLDMVLLKLNLRYRLLSSFLTFGEIVPFPNLRRIPLRLFANLTGGCGYVNAPFAEESNTLPNRLLWGGGPALDVVFFYGTTLQLQYSVNDLAEGGFFVHFKFSI